MSVVVESPGSGTRALRHEATWSPHAWRVALPFAAAAVIARLLILRLPLTSDEGGYLLAASQWHHAASTYGAYFVDRPPLLMAIYAVADTLGGGVGLRLIGVLAAAVAVLVAGRIGGRLAAATAALLVITPQFGTTNVDGELLALPFVLGGICAVLHAVSPRARHPRLAAGEAGALGTGAFLVKQDMIDVFLAVVAVAAVLVLQHRRSSAVRLLGAFAGGALTTGCLMLALAWTRGTSPLALWDALVTFRVQAGKVISAAGSAAGGTSERLHAMLLALALSGAPLVVLAALIAAGRPRRTLAPGLPWAMELRWVALPVLGWEIAGALLGGSYWLHYLIALIPGLVILVAAVPHDPMRRWQGRWLVVSALVVVGISTTAAFAGVLTHRAAPSSDARVSAYLAAHRSAGDTAVVGFGHPDIVYDAGMTSPYEHLWSLSARVRDPGLTDLTAVMRGPAAPQWVVVAGHSLGTWGVDATLADQVLHGSYRLVMTSGDWEVFEHR